MGAGGWFICGVIYSMLKRTDTEITKNGSGHNLGFMYESHNYDALTSDYPNEFWYYSEEEFNSKDDISEGINWFKDHLTFTDNGLVDDWHIIRTHSRNINTLVYAIGVDNVKIVNIHHAPLELTQMIYNFVYKTIFTEPDWMERRGHDVLENLEYHWPGKYTHIVYNDLIQAVERRDAKFLTWILKLSWKQYWERYPLYQPPQEFNVFDMHWHEIASSSLNNRLLELANFLNITLTDEHLAQVKQSIVEYASIQKPVEFIV